MPERLRPAWAEVDLAAVRHNVAALASAAAPAAVCAVVKADGYGHGAVPVARAALEAGATWLAVALVEEGVVLRDAGIDAPVLLLSEPAPAAFPALVAARLTPTLYTAAGVAAAAGAAADAGARLDVHVKVDTGMHRVGAPPDRLVGLVESVVATPSLRLGGVWTHFAVADEPGRPFTAVQFERFTHALAALTGAGIDVPLAHAANSAAVLAHPATRLDLVRCGISVYGYDPVRPGTGADLRPALSLRAAVSYVKTVPAGEGISYGLRYAPECDTVVATVPLGYADGVPRRLGALGANVLVGGRRCPIAGTVTMDQFTVDCGPGADVRPGDEVVLLGRQGGEEITADDWAERLGTISYEILCGIGRRVPRTYRP